MAVPKVSKMVTRCQMKYAFVARFVRAHRQMLVNAFAQAFQQDLEEGETEYDWSVLVDGPFRRLRQALQELLDAERRHLDELAGDVPYRAQRDQAARELRALLFDLRDFFRANFGQKTTDAVGFARRLPREPLQLLRQTMLIIDRLGDPGLGLPPSRFAPANAARPGTVEALEPAARRLREAVDLVEHERCKAQVTRAAKLEAMKSFGVAHRATVDVIKAVCRYAGRRDLTRRLTRRSFRRTCKPGPATG